MLLIVASDFIFTSKSSICLALWPATSHNVYFLCLEKRSHKEAYLKAIKERFVVMIRVVRINNVGLPRSGKTSFMRRMMGEIENILAAYQKGEKVQRSTGVAECSGQVVLRGATANFGTISSKTWSVVKDLSEEASMLNQFFYQVANPQSSSVKITPNKVPTVPKKSAAEDPSSPTSSASAMPKPFKGKGAQPNQFSYNARSTLLERVFGFFGVTRGGKEISETFSVIEDAMEIEDWKGCSIFSKIQLY